ITIFLYYRFADKFVTNNFKKITAYSRTLWGDKDSLELITELFLVALVIFAVICLCYKKRIIGKEVFAVVLCLMVSAEGFTNSNIYMTSQAEIRSDANMTYQQQIALADKIKDDSFYRVKTSKKLMDYDLVGSLGYPSISHYTSLTDKNYMFTMKKLGYSSVWMEQGSNGGTVFTDALLSVGYEISEQDRNSIYHSGEYYINELPQKFGLGIITSKDLSQNTEIPESYDRTVVQQYLYNSLFEEQPIVTKYQPDVEFDNFSGGKYHFTPMQEINYNINVEGKQRLYFDCFDQSTTNLSEPIYNSLSISVNGDIIQNTYPIDTNNGVIDLGEFENTSVNVKIVVTSKLDCYSFGLFGIDENILAQTIEDTPTINFKRDKGTLTGSCSAEKGQTCFLSVPYNDGFKIKINGKSVDYNKTFGTFISFPLNEGENNITVSFVPKGFTPGLVLSFIGLAAAIIYAVKRKHIPRFSKVNIITGYAVKVIFVLVFAAVYIMPVLVNLFAANK
ncbi:MAG: YfhO family protein, partial [Oscillospiraceae bacterium]